MLCFASFEGKPKYSQTRLNQPHPLGKAKIDANKECVGLSDTFGSHLYFPIMGKSDLDHICILWT